MAELAYSARSLALASCLVSPSSLSVLVPYTDRLMTYSGREDVVGVELPSLRIGIYGFFSFRLAVKVGSRRVRAQVLQPRADAQRPFMRVRHNPAVGLANDVTATAGGATDWQELSLTFTTTAKGAIVLELWNADHAWPCWFDTVLLE
ncbi:MAG: hypothetical protein M5U12_38165 [Verrucomicrobia bacterium]|nr:hypothetical protein [Verrucomicrobiota bacterium]